MLLVSLATVNHSKRKRKENRIFFRHNIDCLATVFIPEDTGKIIVKKISYRKKINVMLPVSLAMVNHSKCKKKYLLCLMFL